MKDKNMFIFKRIIFTVLTVACVLFIFMQSLKPAAESSDESGRVLAFLNSITEMLGLGQVFTSVLVRKLAHFTEFAVLSACSFGMYKSYIKRRSNAVLVTVATYALVAVTDEFIQLFSDGRACQLKDMVIDFYGGSAALVIIFIFLLFLRIFKKNTD